jgi:hypothetical protein
MIDNFLTPENKRFLRWVKIYLWLVGSLLLLIGVGRLGAETVSIIGTAVETLNPALLSRESVFLAGLFVLVGYFCIYAFAAVGAYEPPALAVLRGGVVLIAIVSWLAAFWLLTVNILYGGVFLLLAVGANFIAYQTWRQAERRELWKVFGQPISRRRPRTVVLLTLGLVAILLAALGIIYAILSDILELPIGTPEPGELLYTTTFDGYNDEWDLRGGNESVTVIDGELVVSEGTGISGAGFYAQLNARRFRDFDLRVQARQISGPDDNAYGVAFRVRDPRNYYHFQISGDGWFRFSKVVEGRVEEITIWVPTDLVVPGAATNEIRVLAKDDEFSFYINDHLMPLCTKGDQRNPFVNPLTGECTTNEPQNSYHDDSFKQGYIGFSAGTTGSTTDEELMQPVVIGFDSLVIVGPQ